MEKFEGGSDNINVFSPGQRYLVLDAGGKNNFNNILESSCNELKPKIFAGLQYSLKLQRDLVDIEALCFLLQLTKY